LGRKGIFLLRKMTALDKPMCGNKSVTLNVCSPINSICVSKTIIQTESNLDFPQEKLSGLILHPSEKQ
jgi:hypothetical protein